MTNPKDGQIKVLKDYVNRELHDRHPLVTSPLNWSFFDEVTCPVQNDFVSCGVYMLLNALRVMRILESTEITGSSNLKKEVEWSTTFKKKEDVGHIRNLMADVVIGEVDIGELLTYTELNAESGKPKKCSKK